jgi:hypothetical protein
MTAVMEAGEVRFEGFSPGTEIWGSTQANFLVKLPGRHAKEAAILLNDPTAKALAEELGRENTQEFREEAARLAGGIIFRDVLERGRPVDSVVMASNAFFEEHPELFAALKAALS